MTNRKTMIAAGCALLMGALFLLPLTAHAAPRLVLVLVIDQFRSDNLSRYESRFLPAKDSKGTLGGFRFLTKNGAYYPFAQYDILQPMTGPGHATILSGSYPYLGGIPANEWYSPEKKGRFYCVEDAAFETVGKFTKKDGLGTSPRTFLGSTVGDELKIAGWPSKVVAIAIKDRASIFLGGHRADAAIWMDPSSFTWVSSEFYFPSKKLPSWVQDLNKKLEAKAGQRFLWEQPHERETSLAIFNITREGPYLKSVGDTFPHTITHGSLSEITSPSGLTVTTDAAIAALDKLGLGRNPKATDILAVSYSSHDYVGHAFGPNSRENEEMVVAEDRTLSRLLNHLKDTLPGGLKDVAIVLTADHGVAPNAEWLAANRMNAGVIEPEALKKKVEAKLTEKFGAPAGGAWLAYFTDFNFWISREALKAKDVMIETAAQEVKNLLVQEPGFAYAISAADVIQRKLPPGMHERRILKTYVPGRSGDVVGIVKPFFYIKEQTANHMASYSYDETVPLILYGAGFKPGLYSEKAEVVDIAPTLSFLLGVVPPSLNEGRVLSEALVKQSAKAEEPLPGRKAAKARKAQ